MPTALERPDTKGMWPRSGLSTVPCAASSSVRPGSTPQGRTYKALCAPLGRDVRGFSGLVLATGIVSRSTGIGSANSFTGTQSVPAGGPGAVTASPL